MQPKLEWKQKCKYCHEFFMNDHMNRTNCPKCRAILQYKESVEN